MNKAKSHLSWTWIIMLLFITLSLIDIRFGLLGFICMTAPIYHALRGRGKIHCSHYCPRGSILGKFLKNISLNNRLPKHFRTVRVKKMLLIMMLTMLSISIFHAVGSPNIARAMGFSIFRLMMVSLAVGVLMGIFFKPRAWCQVCPMGYGTGLIKDLRTKKRDN